MAVVHNTLPGDPLLIDKIVYELKSQGIFDQFRKECIADVDTKPAYQNLRQRVEGSVSGFLSKQKWSSDMNKNQVREMLRKNIYESGFLETGVERIVDQVVNPKMNSVFLPKVTEVVYKFLGIEKPTASEKKENLILTFNNDNLLPTDLEAVSPESEKKFDISNHLQTLDDSKIDEDESPPFEPLEEKPIYIPTEENSIDSHLSGISGLMSHDSNHSQEFSKPVQMEISNQDSALSKQSSDGRLSIVMSDDNETKMEVCGEDSLQKTPKTNDTKPKEFELNTEALNNNNTPAPAKKMEGKSEDKPKSSSKSHDKHRSRHDSSKSDRKDDKDKRSDKDRKEHKDKHSSSRDKTRDKDRRDSKSSNSKSDKDKSERSSDNSKSDKDKDKSKSSSSNSNRHSSSSKDKDKSSGSSKKESSSSSKDRGDHKDRSKSSSSSSISKDKDSKDSKHRDSNKTSKGDSKSSSSKHDSSKSDKHRKDDKHRSDRHSSSSRSKDKDKRDSKKDKKESKDDHFSSKKKPERRSTDRDSNDGQSGLKSSSSSFDSSSASSQTQNKSQESSNSNSNSNNGSGDSGNSDAVEEFIVNSAPITILNDKLEDMEEVSINMQKVARMAMPPALKLIKPKFASNIHEAKRLMKIRKHLAMLEKQNFMDVSRIMNENNRSKCVDDKTKNKLKNKKIKVNNHTIVHNNHAAKPPTKEPSPEPLSPPLKSSVVSAASWDALEAKLHESINYSTCYDVVDAPEETAVTYSKDDCLFLAPDVNERTKRYVKCAELNIKTLQSAIARRWDDKTTQKDGLHLPNHVNNVNKAVKRKFGDYQSDVKNNNKKFNTHHIEVHENFSLPLSPAESDNSIDKKSDTSESSYKSLKKTQAEFMDKVKKSVRGAAKTQRYSSEDLYKPRPVFGGSRRRNGRNLGVD